MEFVIGIANADMTRNLIFQAAENIQLNIVMKNIIDQIWKIIFFLLSSLFLTHCPQGGVTVIQIF